MRDRITTVETVDPWLRWARAGVLATVATLVAIWAHVGADGRLPSGPVLLAVALALTVAARPLLARPASAVRVVLLTVGGQALAHAGLSLAAGHERDADPAADGTHAPVGALGHHALPATDHGATGWWDAAPSVPDPVSHLLADLAEAGAAMALAHLAAAAVVGAWLAGGERALWTLLAQVWSALALPARPCHVCPSAARRHRAATPVAVRPLLDRVAAGSVVRRGPPLLLAA